MACVGALSFLSLTLLLHLLSPAISAVDLSKLPKHKVPSSPFGFLKHLQGCHKGENVKGIQELKKYLEHFGYLSYAHAGNHSHANDDDFDDFLESAVKTYQINYHLNASGVLDAATVSKMAMPRCGVADIINGTSRMRSTMERHENDHGHSSASFHSVSRYTFFPGNPKWPATKTHLTYAFRRGTRTDAMIPVQRAFRTWAANTHFTFSRNRNFAPADIKISFDSGDHSDGNPFDGQGGTLAHAYPPTDGRFHYDADEPWSVSVVQGSYHLETVALHEIGHLLGLMHSSVEGAIMFPSIAPGVAKGLHGDDIEGIRALYNN